MSTKDSKTEQPCTIYSVIIGQTYSIIENGKRIYGKIESYHQDKDKFLVKWDDGEITLEDNIDKAL